MSLFQRGRHRFVGPAVALLGVVAVGVGCPAKPPEKSATPGERAATGSGEHKDDSGEHEKLPPQITLPPGVEQSAGIKTTLVQPRRLPATVDLAGEVAADPDLSVHVVARAAGLITEVRFKEGQRVAAGALLVVLDSAELARTQAGFLSVQARAQAAQKNAERLAALAQSGLAAGQEVLSAQAEARSLQAEAQAAERGLRTAGLSPEKLAQGTARLEVRAAIAGFALSRHAIVGQAVQVGHVFTDLVNLERAYFVGRLFEKNVARVQVGEATQVRLNAYPDEVFVGQVESIGKQLDPVARTVVARIILIDHQDLLKVGLFGKARVSRSTALAEGPPHLVIPLGAVTDLAGKQSVFVRQLDGHFTVHPVTLGYSASGFVEVLSGLRAGEQVVTDGTFTLKSVVLKSSFGEEE